MLVCLYIYHDRHVLCSLVNLSTQEDMVDTMIVKVGTRDYSRESITVQGPVQIKAHFYHRGSGVRGPSSYSYTGTNDTTSGHCCRMLLVSGLLVSGLLVSNPRRD